MKVFLHQLFIALLLSNINFTVADDATKPLRICSDHYPPYSIYLSNTTDPIGTLIDTARIIAKRLDIDIEFTTNMPFKRCLLMMRTGEVDAMLGLLGREDRYEFMHMIQYLEYSNKSFYTLDNSDIKVNDFNDLEGHSVGVVAGFNYYSQFDNETQLFKKISSNSADLSFKRLIAGRIELAISTDRQMEFFLFEHPEYHDRIKRLEYQIKEPNAVYMGLSKKSAHTTRLHEFELVLNEMMLNHEFDIITKNFLNRYASVSIKK